MTWFLNKPDEVAKAKQVEDEKPVAAEEQVVVAAATNGDVVPKEVVPTKEEEVAKEVVEGKEEVAKEGENAEEEDDEEDDDEDDEDEAAAAEDLNKDEEQIKDEAEADEISNLQRAWEMFELAKLVYTKNFNEDVNYKNKRVAECLLKLGEISIEQEIFEQAITEYATHNYPNTVF